MSIPRPDSSEYNSFYAGYVARVPEGSPIDMLDAQRARVAGVLSPLSEAQAMYRYAPGKWSIKELVGHLSDAERIFAYRLLRISRGDSIPLPGFEEDEYVRAGGFDRRPIADLIDDWASVRAGTMALVRGIAADAWENRGTVNGSPVSARALAYIIPGHVEHHLAVLESRYGLKRL